MTDDLISRQAAIDVMELLIKDLRKDTVDVMNFGHNYNHGVADAIATLKHLPSAERRGRWMIQYGEHEAFGIRPFYRFCSECNEVTVFPYRYCPNCGARMEVE